jgi:branched-chain amino acid transport system substrate-binding protein
MLKSALLLGAALALGPGPAIAQSKSVKIGFISTFSGPTAVMGNDMRNSFELALDHLGRKMGGLPVEVIYEDDQQRPDVGKQKTDKLIESEKSILLSVISGRTFSWPPSSPRPIPKHS